MTSDAVCVVWEERFDNQDLSILFQLQLLHPVYLHFLENEDN